VTVSADLVAFVAARLDEDEQTARKAFSRLPGQEAGAVWSADYSVGMQVRDGIGHLVVKHSWVEPIEHMTRFDPKRMLDDVESKRRIVEHCAERLRDWPAERHDSEDREMAMDDLATVVKCLALPYAEHPDYQEAWRP
jgi:hypothetical protein